MAKTKAASRAALRATILLARESLTADPPSVASDSAADALAAVIKHAGRESHVVTSPVDSPLVCVQHGEDEDWFTAAVIVRAAELVADGDDVAWAIESAEREMAAKEAA